jgi:hypothetical protein
MSQAWIQSFCRYLHQTEAERAYRYFFLFKSQFILQAVVIHLSECYGDGVLQCLWEETLSRASPQIVGARPDLARGCALKSKT